MPLERVELSPPRVSPPRSLAEICSADPYERVTHAYGKSYRDVVRAFRGQFDNPPDLVARPHDEREIIALLDWCAETGVAAIPYGGGTSVVGGVEPRGLERSVSIDLGALNRVLEVDPVSLAARIGAGTPGPAVERQLHEHDLTLRFYPQSFEFSTVGGWIATRAGGHFATLATHVDDLVESVRALTAGGVWESRRLPGSGAGPSPDRLLLGSEGALGVITEAWLRVQRLPRHRASASVAFPSFAAAAAGARAVVQAGLWPANCRALDELEAQLAGVGTEPVLLLGFESADHPLDAWLDRALECCGDLGGTTLDERRGERSEAAGRWRQAFLAAPYLRDTLVAGGILSETFETAHPWAGFDEFVGTVRERVLEAAVEACGTGRVSCRLTHVYPDGAAPYFTVLAPARRGAELEQWDAIKAAACEAVIAGGGTITHHHAVGRDHRPWYDRQRPDPFAAALRAAKGAVDPAGVMNPGVLV